MFKKNNKKRGIALFISIIVTSVLAIIIAAISNIAYNEIKLSATGKESQVAFFAANTGIECALYWDNEDAFPTESSILPNSNISCKIDDSLVEDYSSELTNCAGDPQLCDASYTFYANNLGDSGGGCAEITVRKYYNTEGLNTQINSRGRDSSDCSSSGFVNLDRTYEREIQVDY